MPHYLDNTDSLWAWLSSFGWLSVCPVCTPKREYTVYYEQIDNHMTARTEAPSLLPYKKTAISPLIITDSLTGVETRA